MKNAFKFDLLVIDVETTGSDPARHEIVDIGAVVLDRGTLDERASFSSRVKPERFDIAEATALEIHGLTFDALQNAPRASNVLDSFINKLGLQYILTGWNIGFDTAFLRKLFDECGRSAEFAVLDYHRLDLWSILQFAWSTGLGPIEPGSLSDVCLALGIQRCSKHNALEDARIAAEILRRAVEEIGRGADEIGRDRRIITTRNV